MAETHLFPQHGGTPGDDVRVGVIGHGAVTVCVCEGR